MPLALRITNEDNSVSAELNLDTLRDNTLISITIADESGSPLLCLDSIEVANDVILHGPRGIRVLRHSRAVDILRIKYLTTGGMEINCGFHPTRNVDRDETVF